MTNPTTDRLKAEFRKLMFDELRVSSEVDSWMKILLPFIFGKVVETVRAEEKEKNLEALKLWRPYFYRDKITDEDIAELPNLFASLSTSQETNHE